MSRPSSSSASLEATDEPETEGVPGSAVAQSLGGQPRGRCFQKGAAACKVVHVAGRSLGVRFGGDGGGLEGVAHVEVQVT